MNNNPELSLLPSATINGDKGYFYIAIGEKYRREAEISAKSLQRFTTLPICLLTDDEHYSNPVFSKIIYREKGLETYANKIFGLLEMPFAKTIFLDSDTFVCSSIDNLFDVLALFDMAMCVDNFMHSYGFFRKYAPGYTIPYEKVIPEYNTGVVVIRRSDAVMQLLNDWLQKHEEMNIKADMPSFREAYLKNFENVRISPLPFEYNYHGTHSFGFLYNEVKVIHERLGEQWNTLTTKMLSFDKMNKYAKRINRHHVKRIVVPYFGVIPYMWSPFSIKKKIKKMLGVKRTKKAETF